MTLSRAKGGEWEAQKVSPNCPSARPAPQPPATPRPLLPQVVVRSAFWWELSLWRLRPLPPLPWIAATRVPTGLPASNLAHSPAPGRESKSDQATPLLAARIRSTHLDGNFQTPGSQASSQLRLGLLSLHSLGSDHTHAVPPVGLTQWLTPSGPHKYPVSRSLLLLFPPPKRSPPSSPGYLLL